MADPVLERWARRRCKAGSLPPTHDRVVPGKREYGHRPCIDGKTRAAPGTSACRTPEHIFPAGPLHALSAGSERHSRVDLESSKKSRAHVRPSKSHGSPAKAGWE